MCGGILFGGRDDEGWAHDAQAVDFFDLKGDVERLVALGGKQASFARADDAVLHPGQSATVALDGETAGRLGRLHPEVEAALGLPPGVFIFELDVAVVGAMRPRRHVPLSRHPAVRRDLAIVVADSVDAAQVEEVVRRSLGELATDFRIFDVYRGEGVAEGSKSIAVAIHLQHPERTLTEAEIRDHVDRAVAALGRELDARLR